MTAPAYLLVTMRVTDMEQYKKYMAEAPPTIRAHGGEYLVRGGRQETFEGDWNPHRIAMLRFPSWEQAKAWWDDEQYKQRVRPLRQGATEYFNIVLVEGVEAPV
jgi:uncharacterized protein (DUF1330 family)